jgi:hypothetical protein
MRTVALGITVTLSAAMLFEVSAAGAAEKSKGAPGTAFIGRNDGRVQMNKAGSKKLKANGSSKNVPASQWPTKYQWQFRTNN